MQILRTGDYKNKQKQEDDGSQLNPENRVLKLISVVCLLPNIQEEVFCQMNPANNSLFIGLIQQIVTFLLDYRQMLVLIFINPATQ